jgi:DNA-binding response OmpR family regulator
VLVAEDEALIVQTCAAELTHAGLVVCGVAATERQAVRFAFAEQPDVALVNVRLAAGCGLAAAWAMARARVPVLFVTALPEQALGSGIGLGCLEKPFAMHRLPEVVSLVRCFHETGTRPVHLPCGLRLVYRT